MQAKVERAKELGRKRVQLLTVKEVAELLGIGVRSVWRLSASAELARPLRLGRRTLRWRLSAVQDYLDRLEKEAAVST